MSNELGGGGENTGALYEFLLSCIFFLKAISKAKLDFDRTNAE